MSERTIAAYDVLQRVKTYDADMELMHPNRSKMIEIALEVLPFPGTAALRAIDLGIGTGYFTECFLNKFPNGRVLGIDGAPAMNHSRLLRIWRYFEVLALRTSPRSGLNTARR